MFHCISKLKHAETSQGAHATCSALHVEPMLIVNAAANENVLPAWQRAHATQRAPVHGFQTDEYG